MSKRHFQETVLREEGRPVPRYRLVCGSCGCGETLGRQNFGQTIADTQVPKKFEAKGWVVGHHPDGRDDRCPACANREQDARRRRLHVVPQEEPVPVSKAILTLTEIEPPKPAPALADKPREPTRDERRLVFAKLEEVYVDERAGYSAGWTDARVAQDLGIPRAWVGLIREENFGPGVSDEVEKTLAEVRAVAAQVASFQAELADINARGADLMKRVEASERAAKRIEGAMR